MKEFIYLAEGILCKVEKKLCRALKDVLEGREVSRKYLNTFLVKENIDEIEKPDLLKEYKDLNCSYKNIVHNVSDGSRYGSLMNLVISKEPKNKVKFC
jgi:hypothetical protein